MKRQAGLLAVLRAARARQARTGLTKYVPRSSQVSPPDVPRKCAPTRFRNERACCLERRFFFTYRYLKLQTPVA